MEERRKGHPIESEFLLNEGFTAEIVFGDMEIAPLGADSCLPSIPLIESLLYSLSMRSKRMKVNDQ